jgi:hypothetical protein
MKNIFEKAVSDEIIARINKLTPQSQPLWGKMSVGQMFAHCCVTYEMVYTDKHKKPNALLRWILKTFIKKKITQEGPYIKNSRTAPQFIIKETRDFELEKKRLIEYINETQQKGATYFDGKESLSFGVLSSDEWNIMFTKHLDHHLSQFGV